MNRRSFVRLLGAAVVSLSISMPVNFGQDVSRELAQAAVDRMNATAYLILNNYWYA